MIKLKDILLEIIETQYLNERAIGELLRFWKIKDYDKFRESLISKLNVLSDKMENPEYKKSIKDADTKFLNRSNVSSLERDNPIKIIYDIIYKIVNGYGEDTSTRSSIIKNIDFSKYKGLDNVPLEVISNLDEFMSSLDNIVDQKRVAKEKELEEESNKVIEFSKTLKDSLFSKKENFDTDTTSSINIGEDIIKELFKVFKDSKIITVNDNTLIYKFLESIKEFLYNSYHHNISDTDAPDKQYVEVNKVKLYKSYVEKLVDSKKLDKHISDFIFSTTPPSLLSILSNIKNIILNSSIFVITEKNYNPVLKIAQLIGKGNVATDDDREYPEMMKYKNSKTLINFYTLNDPFNRYTIDDLVSGKINKHINNPLVRYNSDIITKRKVASATKVAGDNLYNAIMKLSPNPGVLYHGSKINISANTLLSGQRAYEQMGVAAGSPVDAVYCSSNLSEAYGYSGMQYWADTYRGEFEKAGKNHEKAESSKQVIENNLYLKTDLRGKLNIYKVTFNPTWAKTALNSNKYVNKYDIDNKQLEGGWFSPYDRDHNIKNKKLIYKFALHSSMGEAFLFYDMGDFQFNHKAELLISAKNLRTCYELNEIIGGQNLTSRDEAAIIEIDKKYNN